MPKKSKKRTAKNFGTSTDACREKIAALKEKVVTAENFTEAYEYFWDHLSKNSDFLQLSKKAKHPHLKKVLTRIGEKLFAQDVTITNLLLMKIRTCHFYHGAFFIQGKPAAVLFFEDIGMGLICIGMSMKTYETSFIRFSSIDIEHDIPIILQPSSGSKIIH